MTTMLDATSAGVASVDEIRSHFPALHRVHNGNPVAYFDGPGGTQVPRQVVRAMEDYLLHHNANTHWRYPTSEETDALIASSRETLAMFMNGRADEIAFGQNMTSLTFHVARAFPRTFRLALLEKDIGIAAGLARQHRVPAPVTMLTADLFRVARGELGEIADHVEIVKMIEQWSGVEIA
jgi:selenocysteine lyase/cysteine desulfurase